MFLNLQLKQKSHTQISPGIPLVPGPGFPPVPPHVPMPPPMAPMAPMAFGPPNAMPPHFPPPMPHVPLPRGWSYVNQMDKYQEKHLYIISIYIYIPGVKIWISQGWEKKKHILHPNKNQVLLQGFPPMMPQLLEAARGIEEISEFSNNVIMKNMTPRFMFLLRGYPCVVQY